MELDEFKNQLAGLSKQEGKQPEIERIIRAFFIGKAIPTLDAAPPFLARARPNDRPGEEVFSRKDQVSYHPDPDKILWDARASYRHEQLFYAATVSKSQFGDCQNTALLETSMKFVKDHTLQRVNMTLTRWKRNRLLHVSILPFSKKGCKQNEDFRRAAESHRKMIDEGFAPLSDEDRLQILGVLEYMSDLFCQPEEKESCYRITAAYYHVIRQFFLDAGKPFDGLIYPSACTGGAGMNIALEKSAVDSHAIDLDLVIMMAMQRAPDNPTHITYPLISNDCIPDAEGNFDIGPIW